MAHGTRFTVGSVVALNFQDGCGFTVGTIIGESFKYSFADGAEHTFLRIQPADGQGLDEPFQVTIDELYRYGVALPASVLVTAGGIEAAN